MSPQLLEELNIAITATATVIGFLLGLDIARLYDVRNRMLSTLGMLRMEAYVKARIDRVEPGLDLAFFDIEHGVIANARAELNNQYATGVAILAFFVSAVCFLLISFDVIGPGTVAESSATMLAAPALLLMQILVSGYHAIVWYTVKGDLEKARSIPDLVALSRREAEPGRAEAIATLTGIFPGWERLIGRMEKAP